MIVTVDVGIGVFVGVKVNVAVGVSVANIAPSGWSGWNNQTTSRMSPITTKPMAPYTRKGPLCILRFRYELITFVVLIGLLGGVRFSILVSFTGSTVFNGIILFKHKDHEENR